jgi:hypothetical protein
MLVDVSDLADYMDLRFTNRQSDSAEIVLEGIQSEIETFLRRPIESQEFDEIYHVPIDYRPFAAESYFYDRTQDRTQNGLMSQIAVPYALYLRQTPVTNVDTVRIKGRSGTWQDQLEDTHWKRTRWGIELFTVAPLDEIEVVYDAGLDGTTIPYLRLVILRAASREMQNMVDDVVGLKDLNARQITVADIGLTEAEKATLKRWKRKQI